MMEESSKVRCYMRLVKFIELNPTLYTIAVILRVFIQHRLIDI